MIINYFAKFAAKVLYFSDTCKKKSQKLVFSAIFLLTARLIPLPLGCVLNSPDSSKDHSVYVSPAEELLKHVVIVIVTITLSA